MSGRKREASTARAAHPRRLLSLLKAVCGGQSTPETLAITGIVSFPRQASGSGRHADVDIDRLRPPKHHCGEIPPATRTAAPSRLKKITACSMKTQRNDFHGPLKVGNNSPQWRNQRDVSAVVARHLTCTPRRRLTSPSENFQILLKTAVVGVEKPWERGRR